jgi:hypothetical protein
MIYEFRCFNCGQAFETRTTEPGACPNCSRATVTRNYSFSVAPAFKEHWNNAVGHYVSNDRQFRDSLKVQSEEMSNRMGMNVDYQPLSRSDMAEQSAHGVTEEGLDHTRKIHHDG